MPRFVILTHDHPQLHWDLMLEQGEVLWTWRLKSEPAFDVQIETERLPDHRPHYLTYEGPVSQNRGTVCRWDHGEFEVLNELVYSLRVSLTGNKMSGVLEITHPQERGDATFRPSD